MYFQIGIQRPFSHEAPFHFPLFLAAPVPLLLRLTESLWLAQHVGIASVCRVSSKVRLHPLSVGFSILVCDLILYCY